MKFRLTLLLLLSIAFKSFSQYVIVLKDHNKVECNITSIDSTKYYIDLEKDGKTVSTFIYKSEVLSYEFKGNVQPETNTDKRTAISIGVLMGGGSLIGADLENMLTERVGFQVGAGLVGFGAGLNLHFKPSIRSSFISLQYWHQGLGPSYTQSLAGVNYVYRARKVFTCQIGLGALIETGPGYPKDKTAPGAMLTYALGVYF